MAFTVPLRQTRETTARTVPASGGDLAGTVSLFCTAHNHPKQGELRFASYHAGAQSGWAW